VPRPGETAKQAEKKEGGGSNALKQLFMTLLFLTAGLALIVFVGDYLVGKTLAGLADTTGFSQFLKTTGWMIVYGMGGLTVLICLAWIATLRRPK
jgi:hypothetical protein